MDWMECIKEKIAKEVKVDNNLCKSIREIAETKIKSADALPKEFSISKISLLYDALREILESITIQKGFKIYNHEGYTAFIREILNLSEEADIFNKLRKIRNGINYYGRKIHENEATEIILQLKNLIQKFKILNI